MTVVRASGLSKTFQLKQKAPGFTGSLKALINPQYKTVDAVRGISFEVEQGEMLALIGPNGAGKSTTIKMLIGLLYPTAGEIDVLGYNPVTQRQTLAYYIGTVFGQKSQLWYHLPPQDAFDLLSHVYELDERTYRRQLHLLTDLFQIGPFLHTPVRKLSLGQRMKCEIAASLLHNPKLILLDEPTIGLDVVGKQQIREALLAMNQEQKTTILLTSHDVGDIEALCKRVTVINHGTIMFNDQLSALRGRFIKSKVLDVRVAKPMQITLPDVEIEQVDGFRVRIRVDLDRMSSVTQALVTNFPIADISITEPSLEEVIRAMYFQTAEGA